MNIKEVLFEFHEYFKLDNFFLKFIQLKKIESKLNFLFRCDF